MTPGIISIVLKTIKYYRKPVFYQVLIIALLSAVITGSLLTGSSVRLSLKKTAADKLGNTGIVVSSGNRYFDNELVKRVGVSGKIKCSGLIEITGISQSLITQKEAFNTTIFAVDKNYFAFQGIDSVMINRGEVAVNRRLAEHLELTIGDDIIIRFSELTDIPADAPFAPAAHENHSIVLKIGRILDSEAGGNFSLSISQILPMNIFINLEDFRNESSKHVKVNRLLIDKNSGTSGEIIYSLLKDEIRLSDVGLRIRKIDRTGEIELTSDRIFLDEELVNAIGTRISSAPVLTYLGNRISTATHSTPYSFVAALPASLYPETTSGNDILINRWLADDLSVNEGDSVRLFWYAPDSLNKLVESSDIFTVRKIVEMKGLWADSLLMPEFPGIAGSESCSDWDAGVPIKMDAIRDKDEEYWNKFKGTPKAFINYEKGKELWGSNFGPATAIRFASGTSESDINEVLNGSLDPGISGFYVTNLSDESIKAADESVDFGTLFISLGFFLIVAAIVLLSFAVSFYFDSKKGQVRTLFALGFKNKWIQRLLFLESLFIGFAGCLSGAFGGYLVSMFITMALNSVWKGAVQTNTLNVYFSFAPLIAGFVTTFVIMIVFMFIKTRKYLGKLNRQENETHRFVSSKLNLRLLTTFFISTVILFAFSLINTNKEIILSFVAGAFFLVSAIFFWRQYYIDGNKKRSLLIKSNTGLSRLFYAFNPSHSVTPVLFIAAGIFAVFITGVNRKDFSTGLSENASGTGGYLLWCESNIPVKENLNTLRGLSVLGLDDDTLADMRFTEIKRVSGNDASCLNLNHITAPPLLGASQDDFKKRNSFSFSKHLKLNGSETAWDYLGKKAGNRTIYGVADQTVLDWGLKISVGDTLIMRAETGQPLNIIIAGGLQSSVFQGYVIISKENLTKYFPSVSGSSVILVDGNQEKADSYKSILNDRLSGYGVSIGKTSDRLESFYEVTNTYLSVFGVFGAFGMITGIAGLGFVLLRNYNQRKRELAVMLAAGFTFRKIRRIIMNEQIIILMAGTASGVISAIIATLPSLRANEDIPWLFLLSMIVSIAVTGLAAIFFSVRSISGQSLIMALKKE